MRTPAVCIDCSPLLVRSAGVKTYIYHWVRALRSQSPATVRTFLAPDDLTHLQHEGGVRMHPRQIAMLLSLNRLPAVFCEIAAPRCDIFHVSNLLHRVPRSARLSSTIHDLTPWVVPECHTPVMVAADMAFAERVLKPAAGLIAVSECTKNDAVRILGLQPDKIRVIPLGVPDTYRGVPKANIAAVRERYKLQQPYFLFVGTIEPRKNVDRLLDAWLELPAAVRSENQLLVVGPAGWRSETTMTRLRQTAQDDASIEYVGYVPEPDLPPITAGARALVCPSLYEGFGIPVAQAMAAGCPVITSNVSSLPEVTAGAALLVDPRSTSELKTAICRIADSSSLRAALSAAGIKQAARYTWEAAASASLRYFAEIA